MANDLTRKVDRLNELSLMADTGKELTENELKEQGILRGDIVNYIRYAITKRLKK